MSDEDFENQMTFAKEIVNTLNVQKNGTRVGAVLYSDQVVNALDMNDLYDRNDVIATLEKTNRTAGNNRLDLAIKHIRTKSFRRGLARKHSAQLAIVITGSPVMFNEFAKQEADRAKESDIVVIPIGVGHAAVEEVKSLSGSSGKFYTVPSFSQLPSLIAEVAIEACRGKRSNLGI